MGKKSNITLITLILAGESIFFLPFVIARIFRPTLLSVFQISNTELGLYFSTYGVVAMVSYFFGGPLADAFSSRNLMSIALWLTGLGGLLMATLPTSSIMAFLYAFWGFTTILLFWAALIKATRQWGGDNFQGRSFGWLEGGRGLTAALLGSLVLLLFSRYTPENSSSHSPEKTFQYIIILTSVFTFFVGILVWFFVPHSYSGKREVQQTLRLKPIFEILKTPSVYLLSTIVVCAYVAYKITDNFTLFAKDVLGYTDVQAAALATVALWARAIVAVLAGYFGDKFKSITVIQYCFVFSILGGLLLAFGTLYHITLIILLQLLLVMVGVYGVRALYFALINDAHIPIKHTGTAVGVISVIGFTPDVFMSPWMGYLLDNNPGATGHEKVFLVLACFAALGFIASVLFKRTGK